jgi:glycine/D-amino acid oxidase-like deaminating enzyme
MVPEALGSSGRPMGSYWQLDAGWGDCWTNVPLPRAVDVAVIGGGFAGLMTAIRLRELDPRAAVVVLEAERIGFGASGRNAGFLSPLAAPVWLIGARRSPEQAWGAARMNHEVHDVAGWIGAHVPACELAPATLALRAEGRVSDAVLREFTRAVAVTGLQHELRESRTRARHLCLEMAAYTLHPYKLARGLAEYAEREGVGIHERARVRRIEGMPAGGATVHFEDGTRLAAAKVVVCTNAYTASIDHGERLGATVVHSFMTATAPTDDVSRDADFTAEVNGRQAYHRMHDRRVIYGGIDKVRVPGGSEFAVPARQRQGLSDALKASFPGRELAIEQVWSGRFHATRNGLPIIRRSGHNAALVLNVGYGGTGVALSLVCARLAACVAADRSWVGDDDARLMALIQSTRLSVRDSVQAAAHIAWGAALPWLRR